MEETKREPEMVVVETDELPADIEAEIQQEMKRGTRSEVSRIVFVVAFYFVVSISLVFLNNYVMKEFDFGYPIFVTLVQQTVGVVCFAVAQPLKRFIPILSVVPPLEFDLKIAKQVLPMTCVFVGMLSFNNICLRFVEVWFYQVARSLSPFFSILFTYLFFGTKTSRKSMAACAIVVLGFILGSVASKNGGEPIVGGDSTSKVLGIIFGLLSSAFVALNSIMLKNKLPVVDNNEWRLMIYNNILSVPLLLPMILAAGETDVVHHWLLRELVFWIDLCITGVFGFLIAIATFMQVKYTSPLTNNISGIAKACLQTILSIFIFHSYVERWDIISIAVVLGGSAYYSYVRYQEMMEKKKLENPQLK